MLSRLGRWWRSLAPDVTVRLEESYPNGGGKLDAPIRLWPGDRIRVADGSGKHFATVSCKRSRDVTVKIFTDNSPEQKA